MTEKINLEGILLTNASIDRNTNSEIFDEILKAIELCQNKK